MRKEIAMLSKKGLIEDVTPVTLTKAMIAGASPKLAGFLRLGARSADVYRFLYRSQGLRVVGYLALPKRLTAKTPCVIYNRGGSFEFGKITPKFALSRLAQYASWGYVVIASQYRGNDGGEGHDELGGAELNDILKLRDLLGAIPQADTKRIGMVGGSRGGMMTYLALAKVRWIKAAVTMAGLADAGRNGRLRPDMIAVAKKGYGDTAAGAHARSAVLWTKKFPKKTPLLMMHGTADWRVSALDSMDLSRKLYEQKVPHRLVIFEGADHGLTEVRGEVHHLTRYWLDRFVKNGEPLPNLKLHGE